MEVVVEKLVYGGYGLAHHQGQVVLIPFAAPGDRLLVKPVRNRKNYTLSRIERIIEAAPERREPHCRYFQTCGGCQLQHLTYEVQRQAKLGFIRESLSRIGKIEWPHEIPLLSGPEFNYRLRAQLKLQVDGTGLHLGYFKPESHELCVIESCPLLSPRLNDVLEQLRLLPANLFQGMQTISLVEGSGEQVASYPALNLSESDNVLISVGEFRYTIDAQTFFQVNRFLSQQVVQLVVGDEQGQCVLDLYCGAGFFTIPLSGRFERAIGVESSPRAVRLALENARRNNAAQTRFVAAPVEDWLQGQGRLQGKVDLVVVDPPRSGLTRKIIHRLVRLRPGRITYVSCNPTTLARDLKHLCRLGYALSSLTAIDLFPQTFHIETVAKLQHH